MNALGAAQRRVPNSLARRHGFAAGDAATSQPVWLKFIFVHDPYYNPLLGFAGWRQVETYDSGAITALVERRCSPRAQVVSDSVPAPWKD